MREAGDAGRSARRLRCGAALLLAVLAAGLAAPWLATDEPWVAKTSTGTVFPAWSRAASGGDVARPVIRAPVPHDPDRIHLERSLQPPSAEHWCGTDALGRDVASRLVHGSRVSLTVGLLSAAFALLVGVPLGAMAGLSRGPVDAVVVRTIEAVLCFPTLLLLLAVLSASPVWLDGLGDTLRISVVLGAVGWVPIARYLRGEVLRVRTSLVVTSARATGAGPARIVLHHILPASLAPVLVTAAFAVSAAVVVEASLSFLGLGVSAPTATWGGMLAEARAHITSAWWMVLFPGVALFVTLLGCNLVGEGIRDALDPRRRDV